MAPLKGLGVLVTRPEQQAVPLCRMLEAQGAKPMCLPAIEIRATGERGAQALKIGALEEYGLVIFTSANAVRFGASLLGEQHDLPLAAIGPATARALNQLGQRLTVVPTHGFETEGLLQHPYLAHLQGRRILLVKGESGRLLLQEELARRGARLTVIDVYRRVPTLHSPAALSTVKTRFAAGDVQVITSTSLDIGRHLLALSALRDELHSAAWLVPSLRVGTGLTELGLRGPLIVAASAEDQDLVAALIGWRRGMAGA